MLNFKISIICLTNIVGLLLFLYGYFPFHSKFAQSLLPAEGTSTFYNNFENDNCSHLDEWVASRERRRRKPLVQNTVLMVIDALRYDFVFTDANEPIGRMKTVADLFHTGNVKAYKANVQPPTVTMPRIKAITGGIVPTFADVVLNFASSSFDIDNVISSAKAINRRLLFYGDDTWLRLFPDHFQHSAGVTSFIVTDYTEVDHNVTRNLDPALSRVDEWDMMILHYIGLDHIGHSAGPTSPLIGEKLAEMDTIIANIYNKLKSERRTFSLVVLGDHGMTDVGSHGGASKAETTVPLLFIGSKEIDEESRSTEVQEAEQVDLAPTLSILLGLPIPVNNVGIVLWSVIDPYVSSPFPTADAVDYVRENVLQITQLYQNMDGFSAKKGLDRYSTITNDSHSWLRDRLCNGTVYKATERNGTAVQSGQFFLEDIRNRYKNLAVEIRSSIIASSIHYNESALYFGLTGISLAWFLSLLFSYFTISKQPHGTGLIGQYLIGGVLLHAFSFGSSSFIEEEHQTWYFFLTTYTAIRMVSDIRTTRLSSKSQYKWQRPLINYGVVLILCRLLRSWNRAGVKWRHVECISDWINQNSNLPLKQSLVCIAVIICCWIAFHAVKKRHHQVTVLVAWTLILGVKLEVLPLSWNIVAVRSLYVVSAVFFILRHSFVGSLLLISLLVKSTNLPLICFIVLVHNLMIAYGTVSSLEYIFFNYYLAMASYFVLGNSNSIGHVDVSSGFVGISTYSPVINGLLIIIHLYSGPLLVCTASMSTPFAAPAYGTDSLYIVLSLKGLSTCFYMFIAYIERYHLFVWSVFAPKLLYECLHMAVVCICCLVLQFAYRKS